MNIPSRDVLGSVLPALGVALVLGNLYYVLLARRLARREALSWIGLIHAAEVAWAAAPKVALGYLLCGLVCLAYSRLAGARKPLAATEPRRRDRSVRRPATAPGGPNGRAAGCGSSPMV
ncbi:hypothetical protein ABTW96_22240 [Nocardia beijingensis]|uniref:hypothetical protein n=1 Tax=Nocardia beijingensis TaxID=95162 RepID=UPI00331D9340